MDSVGTMLQSYGLGEKEFRSSLFSGISGQMSGNYDMLNLTQPEIIRTYIAAIYRPRQILSKQILFLHKESLKLLINWNLIVMIWH